MRLLSLPTTLTDSRSTLAFPVQRLGGQRRGCRGKWLGGRCRDTVRSKNFSFGQNFVVNLERALGDHFPVIDEAHLVVSILLEPPGQFHVAQNFANAPGKAAG